MNEITNSIKLEDWGSVCYLLSRGIPIIYKMFAIHIVMGTYWLFSMANGPLWLWLYWHPEEDQLGSWRNFWLFVSLGSSSSPKRKQSTRVVGRHSFDHGIEILGVFISAHSSLIHSPSNNE